MAPGQSSKLEDQAASAALYTTQNKSSKSSAKSKFPLDADGKLSSAGAAKSLKHAQPQDLPAFPIVGIQNREESAGTAATLANKSSKPFEHWSPSEIPAANRAALLAQDIKVGPVWQQPNLSAAGSKAALLAAREGAHVNIWQAEDSAAGQSAAGQAMRKKGLSPNLDYGHTASGGHRALVAATGAMSGSRKRSDSTPVPSQSYPDADKSAANALRAALSVNRPDRDLEASPSTKGPTPMKLDGGRIHNQAITNLSREMYTSNPPVSKESDEQKKQAGMRAAALSMAKKMYEAQQRQIEEAAAAQTSKGSVYAASSAADRPSTASSVDTAAPQYANLQEAAKKLAAERLAKLHDESAAYRSYYGTHKSPNKRLSVRGRQRASSDGLADGSDEERSRQIRSQMSLFTDSLAQVDSKKRQQDRDFLMAAAQRNVRASMTAQDERVFSETGKISPAMMAQWEAKAKAKAEADSDVRMANHGMVNIGGGRFLDQAEVEAIAAAKVQPTLDEITATAEKNRARDEELRQQELERQRVAAEKTADDKERALMAKEEWRRFKEEEKREERLRKEEAKAKKNDEKRAKDQDKRRSKFGSVLGFGHDRNTGDNTQAPTIETVNVVPEHDGELPAEDGKKSHAADLSDPTPAEALETPSSIAEHEPSVDQVDESSLDQSPAKPTLHAEPVTPGTKHDTPVASRIAPTPAPAELSDSAITAAITDKSPKDKDHGKMSSWLKTKFRRTSRAAENDSPKPVISEPRDPKVYLGSPGTGIIEHPLGLNSNPTAGDASLREVALAGKDTEAGEDATTSKDEHTGGHLAAAARTSRSTSISSLSSDEDVRGRTAVRLADMAPGAEQGAASSGSAEHDVIGKQQDEIKTESAIEPTSGGVESRLSMREDNKDEHFSDTVETLQAPDTSVIGGRSREQTGSPARDSKFVEGL